MMKKGIFLALILSLAFAVPALAAETTVSKVNPDNAQVDVDGVKNQASGPRSIDKMPGKTKAKKSKEASANSKFLTTDKVEETKESNVEDTKAIQEQRAMIKAIRDAHMPAIREFSDKLDERELLLESVSANPNVDTAYLEALVKEVADLRHQVRDAKWAMNKEIGEKLGRPVWHRSKRFDPCGE